MSLPDMVAKRLDRRRIAGLALAFLAAVLLGAPHATSAYHGVASAVAPAPEIHHQAISCWPRDEFLELHASFQPPNVPKLDQRRMLSVGRSLKRPGASPRDSMSG